MTQPSRRNFLKQSAAVTAAAVATGSLLKPASAAPNKGFDMAFGLVTFQWGNDWDLPTLIANCEKSNTLGVELRTTHAHGVERTLSQQQRSEVRKRFNNSRVTLVGIGSNERFDNPDPAVVKKALEATKQFIRLSHDVGGSGVKVKPDRFYDSVPHEKTIQQIGQSLNELGEYGAGFGQQVRLEVHGQCRQLPTIRKIMDIASNENVAICWNSNAAGLEGQGLEYNYNLVKDRFGATIHTRELDIKEYPYQKFIDLLVQNDYVGWVMIEASSKPKDRVAALAKQSKLFKEMVAKAQAKL